MKYTFSKKSIINTLSLLLFVIGLGLSKNAEAQKHEFGFLVGGMGFVGDVGETKGISSYQNLKFTTGLIYKYNIDHYLVLRLGYQSGEIRADDKNSDEGFKQNRGLNFHSKISEFSGIIEYNFFSPKRGFENQHHTPYVFAGLSLFSFNPQSEYLGKTYDLQTLGTEGQKLGFADEYSLSQLAIPFGIGYKANVGKRWRVAVELNLRKTFTDYLDDASGTYVNSADINNKSGEAAAYFSDPTDFGSLGVQRASSNNTDWFYSTNFSLTYVLKRSKIKCPQ